MKFLRTNIIWRHFSCSFHLKSFLILSCLNHGCSKCVYSKCTSICAPHFAQWLFLLTRQILYRIAALPRVRLLKSTGFITSHEWWSNYGPPLEPYQIRMKEGRGWAKHESPLLLMHIIGLHNCFPFKVLQSFFRPDTIKTPNFSYTKLRQHKITIDRDRAIKGNGSLHPRTDAPSPILPFTLAVITSPTLISTTGPRTLLRSRD